MSARWSAVAPSIDNLSGGHILLGAAATIVVFLAVLRLARPALVTPGQPPVYPYWIPWLGHALSYLANAEELFAKGRAYFKSNAPFGLILGGQRVYVVSTPDDVRAVYRNSKSLKFEPIVDSLFRHSFGLGSGADKLWVDVPGEGTIIAHAHGFFIEHLAFSAKLEPLTVRFLDTMRKELARAAPGEIDVPMYDWVRETVFNAGTEAIWGDVLLDRYPEMFSVYDTFDKEFYTLVLRFPDSKSKKARATRERLIDILEEYDADEAMVEQSALEMIWKRQKMMYRADMTGREAASVNLSLFWGFHSNLSKTAFWMLMHIAANPSLATQLRAETLPAFSLSSPAQLSMPYLLDSCPLLNASFDETLRLTNSATSVRQSATPVPVGGFMIPKDALVMLPSMHLHGASSFWGPDAESFRPQRFLEREKAPESGWFRPFGGGTTLCPGRYFARRALLSFVAMVLRGYDLEVKGELAVPDLRKPSVGVMEPAPGGEKLRLRLTPRKV